MVLFGAGASYDSVPSQPPDLFPRHSNAYRPPLADELFHDRLIAIGSIQSFPDCLPIVPYLQNLLRGESVEQVLERLREEATEYPKRHRQLAAIRYYLHMMLWECGRHWHDVTRGVTNYKTLLDQIERWRRVKEPICLVTFNYDTLLEEALPSVGMEIQRIEEYIESDTYKLIKLHGSVNWAREVISPVSALDRNVWQIASELISRAANLEISQRYRIIEERPVAALDGVALFPALAIPVETKKNYECPAEHLDVVEKFIPEVTKLLIVGWRGAEAHFLTLLRERLVHHVRTLVVAGSEKGAFDTIERLRAAGIKGDFQAAKAGFTEFILQRESDDFLRK